MRHPLRVVYAAGPGNVLGTYNHWKAGRDDPSQVSITYSGQFYDLCKAHGAEAYVIASSTIPGYLHDGPIVIQHKPTPFQSASGLLFHIGQVWTSCRLIWTTLRFRADVLVIVCGTAHWFPFRILRWLGVEVIPSMHCVLWRKGRPPTGVSRMIGKLNRGFFTNGVASIMSASRDIDAQLRELTGGRIREIHDFLPTYRREQFAGVGDPPRVRAPFRCFYAGRIERNKGVFDLLDIATRFRDEARPEIEFDLCGDGSALAELKAAAAERGLSERFRCHGRLIVGAAARHEPL